MNSLTKKDIEQIIGKGIDPLGKTLKQHTATLKKHTDILQKTSETMDRTTALVANLVEDFKEFRDDMKSLPSTLDSHTTTLDAIFKNTEHWKTEAAALRYAIKRHEDWFAQIADKMGIKLEGLESLGKQP
jgi:chromosome segregation ATPase